MAAATVIVTGPMGSGKSAVCALLRKRGIPVYDSDSRTKRLYGRDATLASCLEAELGQPLCGSDGKLDLGRLAAVIFSDAAAREKVEAVVYPLVLQDFLSWRSRQGGVPFVVLESAVILSKPIFDCLAPRAVVLVTAPEAVRIRRVKARSHLGEEAVRARLSAQQIPLRRVTFSIQNDGSRKALSAAVEEVYSKLIQQI